MRQVSAGYSDTGKRRRKTVYGATKAEVQEKLRQVASEVAAGSPVETSKLTVAEYLDRWLNTIKQSMAPATHDRYESTVKHQLKPTSVESDYRNLSRSTLNSFYVTLKDKGCSPRSIQLAGVTLVAALQHAVKVRLVGTTLAVVSTSRWCPRLK